VPGIGERVDHDDVVAGMVFDGVVDEIGADESGATRHEQAHGAKVVGSTVPTWQNSSRFDQPVVVQVNDAVN
jgi:hypothetical protein